MVGPRRRPAADRRPTARVAWAWRSVPDERACQGGGGSRWATGSRLTRERCTRRPPTGGRWREEGMRVQGQFPTGDGMQWCYAWCAPSVVQCCSPSDARATAHGHETSDSTGFVVFTCADANRRRGHMPVPALAPIPASSSPCGKEPMTSVPSCPPVTPSWAGACAGQWGRNEAPLARVEHQPARQSAVVRRIVRYPRQDSNLRHAV